MKSQTYDLEERLLEYSVRTIKIVEQMPNIKSGSQAYLTFHNNRLMFGVLKGGKDVQITNDS